MDTLFDSHSTSNLPPPHNPPSLSYHKINNTQNSKQNKIICQDFLICPKSVREIIANQIFWTLPPPPPCWHLPLCRCEPQELVCAAVSLYSALVVCWKQPLAIHFYHQYSANHLKKTANLNCLMLSQILLMYPAETENKLFYCLLFTVYKWKVSWILLFFLIRPFFRPNNQIQYYLN